MIDKFIQYVCKYGPNFGSRIRGASAQEIAALQTAVKRPLPEKYKAFLTRMGRDSGGLKVIDEPKTEIDEVLKYYEEEVLPGEIRLPPNHIVIAAGGLRVFELSVECDPEETLPAFILESGEIREKHADSFEKLLYRSAFGIFRARLLPCSAIYLKPTAEASFPAAVKVASTLGFSPLWFSDSISFCSERDDGVVLIIELGSYIRVAAQNRTQAEQVGNVFVQQYGIKFSQWWPA